MHLENTDSHKNKGPKSLADLAIKYDMEAMIAEAEVEFDVKIASRELVDQESIGQFFNLKDKLHARN